MWTILICIVIYCISCYLLKLIYLNKLNSSSTLKSRSYANQVPSDVSKQSFNLFFSLRVSCDRSVIKSYSVFKEQCFHWFIHSYYLKILWLIWFNYSSWKSFIVNYNLWLAKINGIVKEQLFLCVSVYYYQMLKE
jgi:hypothetical protein